MTKENSTFYSAKFTQNPAILAQADYSSEDAKSHNAHEHFPIMSISKSFCGVLCLLMAQEKKFGASRINASLEDVLEIAKTNHPLRQIEIDNLLKVLREKEIADVKIFEILVNKSGIEESQRPEESGKYKDQDFSIFVRDKFFKENDRGQFRYNNSAYSLLEKVLDLSSDSGSYKEELQNKVFAKCDMEESGDLYESESAKAKISNPQILAWGALGRIPLAAGALYSSASDMQKYALQFAKMITGQESLLTQNLDEAQRKEISEIYEASALEGYALGIQNIEMQEGTISSVSLEGALPGNASKLEIKFAENGAINSIFAVSVSSVAAKNLIEPQDEIGKVIARYFDSKLSEEERKAFEGKPLFMKEHYLIEQQKLPKEFFKDFYPKICEAFANPAKKIILASYIAQNGLVDEEKLKQNFAEISEKTFAEADSESKLIFGEIEFLLGINDLMQGKSSAKDYFQNAKQYGFDVKKGLEENHDRIEGIKQGFASFQKIIVDKICKEFKPSSEEKREAARGLILN